MHKRSQSKIKNKISIVFTARNDNYGGYLLDRINSLLKVLIYLTNKYKSRIELLIVDYNPPFGQKKLHEVLKISKNIYLDVRFIVYPPSLHASFPNHKKVKLFEYSAKNIGIRRAAGDYIVSTNQDIIFSEEFVKFLIFGDLKNRLFYRANRTDVNLKPEQLRLSAREILKVCSANAYLVKTVKGDKFLRFNRASTIAFIKNIVYLVYSALYSMFDKEFRKAQLDPHQYHIFASGDFLLMHKTGWNKIGGYDETKEGNDYLDGYALFMAGCMGLQQEIIKYPIYHVDHLMGKMGRPSVRYYDFVRNCNLMIKTKRPYKAINPDWGQKDLRLKEFKK